LKSPSTTAVANNVPAAFLTRHSKVVPTDGDTLKNCALFNLKVGWIAVNIEKSTVSRDYNAIVQVMAYDAYAATNLGLTAIPAVATGSLGAIPTTGTGANQISVNGSGAISTVVSVSGSVGSVAGNVSGNLVGSVGSLTATAVQNIWDDATSSLTVVGSVGKLIVDNLNATVSSRATDATVWTNATRTLTAGTNIVLAKGTGITGFNDITAQNVWDVATSGLTTVGSIGLKLNTNVDTTISSRMATFTYTTPPTAAQISTQVWTEPIPGSFAAGSAGAKLNAASSAGDPWATAIPGSYAAGTAGNILGNRLDVAVSTRMATFTYTTPPTAAAIATQVWSETLPGSYTATQAGFKLNAAGSAADPWATTLPGAYTSGTAGFIIGNRLDAAVSTRSTLTDVGVWTYATRALTDKANFSLASSQTFNMTGNITGSLSGSVGSVSGNVGGSVASVVGSVGGNVVGSVNNVVGNVGGSVVGSVGSVSGAVGSVSNVSNIWDYLTTNILTTNSIGLLLKTNVDAQISSRLASSSYTAAPTTTAIMQALWNQSRATASPTGGVPAAGTFGYYLDSRVSLAGGGGGGVIIKQGPFKLNATQDMGQNDILDLVQNDARSIVLEVIDENNEPIPLSALYTYTVNIYDIGGTGAGTYVGTVDYADGGQVSFDITTTTTATKGTYYVVLSIDNGTIITKYGGLRLEVR